MRTLPGIACILLVGLSAPGRVAAQIPTPTEAQAAVEGVQAESGPRELGDRTLAELMEEFGVPGVSVAVIRDFQVHWAKGYGVADVETGALVDTETVFQAASISKPVAAMAVLRAVREGLFTLDTDVNDILTSWTLDGEGFTDEHPVTPRTLTSHTSGLGDGFGFPGYDPDDPLPTVVQILDGHEHSNVGPLFMERPPMTFAEYSGGGVTLMQQALSDAWNLPFAELMQEKVLGPIGMTRSTFVQPLPADWDANAARAHDGDGQSQGPKWHVYPEQAAAGLWTTPTDLARFAVEVQTAARGASTRVLDRQLVQEMLSPVGVGGFGVGFSIQELGEGWYFQHGGANWGFRATLLAHKVKGYGLAILTNGNRGGAVAAELSRRIQTAYAWDSLADPVRRGYERTVDTADVDVPESVLASYVGEYEIPGEGTAVITLEDGRLFAEPEGQGRLEILPQSTTVFAPRGIGVRIEFVTDASGAVVALIIHQGGRETRAPRVR